MNNLLICFHRKVWNTFFIFFALPLSGNVRPVRDFIRATGISDGWASVTFFLKEPRKFLQPLSTTWQEVSEKAQKPSNRGFSSERWCENKRIISFSFKLQKCWSSVFCSADRWHFSTGYSVSEYWSVTGHTNIFNNWAHEYIVYLTPHKQPVTIHTYIYMSTTSAKTKP